MSQLVRGICAELGLAPADVERIIATAPRRYKAYSIPKRSGGMREIAHPARELKAIQRWLLRTHLYALPVHPSARAYVPGSSIERNARAHAGDTPILKMDFRDFFPSIRQADWYAYGTKHGLFPDDGDLDRVGALLFWRKKGERVHRLSIGAPTSPHISNVLLYEFDTFVSKEAERRGISYTRYADDLTFSGQRLGMTKDMVGVVAEGIRHIGRPKLRINDEKTTFVTAASQRKVTGVVLGNDGSIGIDRATKRLIRAKVDWARKGRLSDESLRSLCGFLAYAKVVDPDFLQSLSNTYGADLIRRIQRMVKLAR